MPCLGLLLEDNCLLLSAGFAHWFCRKKRRFCPLAKSDEIGVHVCNEIVRGLLNNRVNGEGRSSLEELVHVVLISDRETPDVVLDSNILLAVLCVVINVDTIELVSIHRAQHVK